jgi:para-nitrobenzyl esterase
MAADTFVHEVEGGRVEGRLEPERLRVLRGVPYAAPPVGEGRFAPPRPVVPWAGVRPAVAAGPACPQPPVAALLPSHAPAATDEGGCLTLDVMAPAGAAGAPVLVVLHGGGFQVGAGSLAVYQARALAQAGVVVVAPNYRLGALGFRGGPWWMHDQIAALRWVQRHASSFGGDPARVTLFGVSAGGVAVNALNVSPAAAGLFDQVVMVSAGGDLMFSRQPASAVDLAADRVRPLHELVPAAPFAGGSGERPRIGDALIPHGPGEAMAAGAGHARRMLIGYSSHEASFLDVLGIPAEVLASMLESTGILAGYPGDDPATAARHAYRDLFFRAPMLTQATAAAARGVPAWCFEYGYVLRSRREASGPACRGASHAVAAWAMLGTLAEGLVDDHQTPGGEDLVHAAALQRDLLAFVRGGVPAGVDGAAWSPHDPAAPVVLAIGADGERRLAEPAAPAQQGFWAALTAAIGPTL